MASKTAAARTPDQLRRRILERLGRLSQRPGWLIVAGAAALAVALGGYAGFALTHPPGTWQSPVDLSVYRAAGLVARGLSPLFRAHAAAPLYHWPDAELQFTYPPFAALAFEILTWLPLETLWYVAAAAGAVLMLATIWWTLRALGCRPAGMRAGVTLLLGAVLFWTEPVQRVLWLGQVEIALMALVVWDLTQPDRRWWKGAGVGLAAGIKLVPLIFIPYLLLSRQFRQAAVATGVFAATVLAGFAVLPGDSRAWWLDGLFARASRAGFTAWTGNQSVLALVTRLAGSPAAAGPAWYAAVAVIGIAGLVCAARLNRRGEPVAGMLLAALTALLVSPISWDHHWVWLVPGITAMAWYAARRHGRARWALAGVAAAVTIAFLAWPTSLWGQPDAVGGFGEGLIWAAPNTEPGTYFQLGNQPWFIEYHWHGGQLAVGNLYVLTGLALFALLAVAAARKAGQPAGR